jgi:hypothetical protein
VIFVIFCIFFFRFFHCTRKPKGLFKGRERKAKSNQAPDRQSPPPEKQSVRNRLKQLQAESKQRRNRNRHSQDIER